MRRHDYLRLASQRQVVEGAKEHKLTCGDSAAYRIVDAVADGKAPAPGAVRAYGAGKKIVGASATSR